MIKLLVKNRLRGLVHGMLGKTKGGQRSSKAKIALFALLFAYLFACFIFLFSVMAFTFGSALIPVGASWLYFAIFTLATLTILFVLSIFETKSELFDCRDNDLLLSMPIPPNALVASRVIVVLVINYLIEAFVMLPCIIVYAVISGSVTGVIGSLLVSLLIPPVATSLSCGAGYLVALISKRMRRSSLVSLILSLGFLFLYFWGYGLVITEINSFILEFNPENLPSNLKALEFIGNASLLKPLSIIVFAAVSLGIALLTWYLISKFYIRLVTMNKGAKKVKYVEKEHKSRSQLLALVEKELKKFVSSSTYMLNAGLGLIFAVVLSFVAAFNRNTIANFVNQMFPGMSLAPIFIAALVLMSSMNMMSASALSLEGKNLWILKTLPVNDSTVLLSKLLPQVIVCTPPTVLASILIIVASGAAPIYWAFMLLTPIAANVFFAVLGLVFNVAFPKFDFDNEAQPIKQSLSVTLTMLSQMIISFVFCAFSVALSFMSLGILASLIGFMFFVILSAVFCIILFIPCKQKYAKL